jgi:hypothetical protein
MGNFRDLGADFAALGVGPGDLVRISNSEFRGFYRVITRQNASLLSLDLPDEILHPAAGLAYVVFPQELFLGHDAVCTKREHVVRFGQSYAAPTLLSTKTDADFSELSDGDVAALLLVDAGNMGHEVQPITAARVDLGELLVAAPPPAGARAHALSAAAIVRRSSAGVVTEATAI